MNAKRTEPTQSLLQGRPYVPAVKTNLRETFKRIREQQAKEKQ